MDGYLKTMTLAHLPVASESLLSAFQLPKGRAEGKQANAQ